MAESVNDGNSNPAQKPKEMSMEVRLLLAFLLMGAVMFLTPYLFKTQNQPAAKKDETKAAQVQNASAPVQAPTPAPAAAAVADEKGAAPTTKATVQQPQPQFVIETDRYRVT
jgi:YidC/Oxa1 family membrane protein insertase